MRANYHGLASLHHKVKGDTYARLGLDKKAASHFRRAAFHASFGETTSPPPSPSAKKKTQLPPKAVRVVLLNTNAEREIDELKKLPLECDTVTPDLKKWTLSGGNTAVYWNGRSKVENARLEAVLADALRGLESLLARIVVTFEFSGPVDPSFTATFGGVDLEFTTHTLREFGALVYAPRHTVLLDADTHENEGTPTSFLVCTLIPSASVEIAEIAEADYCAGVLGNRLRAESMYLCHQKVLAFARAEKRIRNAAGHEIDGDFDRVFVTSDIHADVRKLVQVLLACGLITIGAHTHESIYENDTNVYDIVWNARWVPQRTLIVICGDLVDSGIGQEKWAEFNALGDGRGAYEFLLHCLLFNLRIQARKVRSDVQFTLGNHDTGTITGCTDQSCPRGIGPFYVYDGHLRFASMGLLPPALDKDKGAFLTRQLNKRRDMLVPFYACSPYLMLTLGKVAFVHAGFVASDGSDVYADALRRQQLLDAAPLEEDTSLVDFFQPTQGGEDEAKVLWTRAYAESPHDAVCTASSTHERFELIAVGHCVTHDYATLDPLFTDQCGIDKASGCVITRDCRANGNGPLIALVDTGMSAVFRGGDAATKVKTNSTREVGMLVLSKPPVSAYELRKVDDYHVYRIRAMSEMRFLPKDGKVADAEVSRFGNRATSQSSRPSPSSLSSLSSRFSRSSRSSLLSYF